MKNNIKDNCTQKNNLTESEIRKRLKIVLSIFFTTILTILIFTIIIGLVHSWDFVLTLIPVIILAVAVIGTSTILVIPKCFQKSSLKEEIEQTAERIDVVSLVNIVMFWVLMGLIILS